jgi:hypothetical protein
MNPKIAKHVFAFGLAARDLRVVGEGCMIAALKKHHTGGVRKIPSGMFATAHAVYTDFPRIPLKNSAQNDVVVRMGGLFAIFGWGDSVLVGADARIYQDNPSAVEIIGPDFRIIADPKEGKLVGFASGIRTFDAEIFLRILMQRSNLTIEVL